MKNYERKKTEIKDVVKDLRILYRSISIWQIRMLSTMGDFMDFADHSKGIKIVCEMKLKTKRKVAPKQSELLTKIQKDGQNRNCDTKH